MARAGLGNNLQSPAEHQQILASIDAPSTAYRRGADHQSQPSAEKVPLVPDQQSNQMQYIQNIQNRMGVLDRSIDKILNVITHKEGPKTSDVHKS